MSRLRSIRARRSLLLVLGVLLIAGVTGFALQSGQSAEAGSTPDNSLNTTTPIKHLVVIYDENISFDHYFGTYPYATNTDGTPFHAAAGTPTDINNELNAGMLPGSELSSVNPNGSQPTTSAQYTSPNPNEYQPQRLNDAQAVTCDQNHSYGPEQAAENAGAMNAFVQNTYASCSTSGTYNTPGLNMDYYDGNTVTGLWNYAQNYAMSDNNWDTVFGPSTPGALNVISGNTASGNSNGTVNGDVDPNGDSFGSNASNQTATMSGANVGDLLNDKGVSWGWFQGGFASESESHSNVVAAAAEDYSAHHDPFQYYGSTKNWAHTPPASGAEIGNSGSANHEYDISDFNDIFSGTAINGSVPALPAVSYLKAPEAQDAHAGYSDPLDEQEWLTTEINQIEQSPYWDSTAIVITYDDTDGWYDHQAPVIANSSSGASGDAAVCTNPKSEGVPELAGDTGRCGPSQRIPLVVISPYAKHNYVSHVETDQVSVPKFIEQNWDTGDIDSISSVPGSFDTSVNGLDDMFDFTDPQADEVLLNSTMYTTGNTSGENHINPQFGAVTSTPADAVAPTPAPKITVNQQTLTLPVGTPLPSDQSFRSEIGASISSGSLSDDFETTVNPNQVGSYQVTLTGSIPSSDAGTSDTITALDPQTITVNVSTSVSLSNAKLYFNEGAAPTSSYISSVAGATVGGGGIVSPIDLSGVDFNTPGAYQVQIDGKLDGVAATPATLTIFVEGAGVPLGQPVVTLNQSLLTYGAGADPTPANVAAAAGASITHGVLDPINLSSSTVNFNVPGTYTVPVTGADAGNDAIPATLTIVVVPVPVVTAALPTIETPVGDVLTSDQVLLDAEASSSEGQIAPVYLSSVNWNKAGQYTVELSATYEGIASATPQQVTIDVVPASGSEPAVRSSTTALVVTRTAADRHRGAVTATVRVVASDETPTGRVSLYSGSRLVKTVGLNHGKATATLTGLSSGTDRLHAGYLGSGVVHSSRSGTAAVVLSRARSHATVDFSPANGSHRATFRIAVITADNTPTGRVALRVGDRVIGSAKLVKGRATVTVQGLAAQTKVKVAYLGSRAVRGTRSRSVSVVYPSKTMKTKRGA